MVIISKPKKLNFSEIDVQIIRRMVARNETPEEIAEVLSKNGIIRTRDAIVNKIWRMKIEYPDRRKLHIEQRKKQGYKAQDSYHSKYTSPEERRKLMRQSSVYTDKWETALGLSGAKMKEIHGQKMWTIKGKPVTVQEIMRYLPKEEE